MAIKAGEFAEQYCCYRSRWLNLSYEGGTV
jgi:hypothetical protein